MRRLMWFSIGFALSCGLCAYILPVNWILPLAIPALILGLAVGIPGRDRLHPRRIAYTLVGMALGLGWYMGYRQIYLKPAIELDGQTALVQITVSDYSFSSGYGTGVDGTVTFRGNTYQVRAYLTEESTIAPGKNISGTFRFRVTTPEGEEEATYHSGKGIFLLAYQEGDATIYPAAFLSIRHYPSLLRQKVKEILKSCFPEDTCAFAKALLLGDTYDLDYETLTAFKVSGIRHIVAISGLHISIFYSMVSLLTFKRRYLTAIVGIPVLFLFAAVAGFTPSVTRACIMVWLMMLATAFHREYDGGTALAFAALVMLLVNPYVITSAGFQLSVAAVAGIYLFSGSIREWMKGFLGKGKGKSISARLNRWFCGSLSVSLGAMSLTTPLCAWYFGTVSLVGVLTNLLTLWITSIIFYGIIAVCVLNPLSTALASGLARIISWCIRYVLLCAKILGKIPLAAVYTKSIYITLWLILFYVLLGLFLLRKKKHPLRLICAGVVSLCLALLCSWIEPLMDECRVTVLDVGQGQCILLQSEGRTYLVDCGGTNSEDAADMAAETLLSQGISRLDGIILTHYDTDHCGGIPYLLTRVDTDALFLPDVGDEMGEEMAALVQSGIIRVWDDLSLTFGEGKIQIFGPIYSGATNENSLCVLFETENCAILITGDRTSFGERMLLRENSLPQVDLLVAGHHGSKTSTSPELLAAVQPWVVAISVGENNGYGHPSPEVLQRLEEFGCAVYRTDQDGTILFRR